MPLAKCHRCNGTGHYLDANPKTGALEWCAGCNGAGMVDVKTNWQPPLSLSPKQAKE